MSYDESSEQYANIPNSPHLKLLATYMWDMAEHHFLMVGKRLDFLAADGFRLDSVVRMMITLSYAYPEYIQGCRIKEAAERYAHLFTDLNMRMG